MRLRSGVLVVAVGIVLILSGLGGFSEAVRQEHFLDFSEDNYKIVFISDNLTAAMTRQWPRVVFQHSSDIFSPTFEVGLPSIYLYNDSSGDGLFALSEATYTAYMDQNHVTWNVTSVEFGNDTEAGEFAQISMRTTLSLYRGLDNETVDIPDWANITFWFRINERTVDHHNSLGYYVVKGKTELLMNFTLATLKYVNTSGVVLGHLLQGGGGTYMFLLREESASDEPTDYTEVSGRVDETVNGLNFTHVFNQTSLPEQQMFFSKDDMTIQAFYHFSTEPMNGSHENASAIPLSSSYFTTGTGLILHNSYSVTNATGSIVHEMNLGIVESGFVTEVSDWVVDNLHWILGISGVLLLAAAGIAYLAHRRRKDHPS